MKVLDAYYTTLEAVKAQKGIDNASEDSQLTTAIVQASSLMAEYCGRDFVPYRATVYYDALGRHVVAGTALNLRDDLLEAITVTNGDSQVIAAQYYALRTSGDYPKWRIELKQSSNTTWTYQTDYQDAITIEGIWGFHQSYNTAWVNTLQVVGIAGLTSTATTITLASVSGTDASGFNAFGVGSLLKIDDEYLRVTAVNTTTNVLTTVRGANGTTAATHNAGVSLYRFAVQQDIERVCKDFALWLHQQRDNAATRYQFLDGSQIVENSAPEHIKLALVNYQRKRIQAI